MEFLWLSHSLTDILIISVSFYRKVMTTYVTTSQLHLLWSHLTFPKKWNKSFGLWLNILSLCSVFLNQNYPWNSRYHLSGNGKNWNKSYYYQQSEAKAFTTKIYHQRKSCPGSVQVGNFNYLSSLNPNQARLRKLVEFTKKFIPDYWDIFC